MDRYRGDSYIQTNDLTELLEEKETERQGLEDAVEEAEYPIERADLAREVVLWDEKYAEELKELKEVCDRLPSDETCICENKIEEYFDRMVSDYYEMPKDLPSFVTLTIDYDALKQDYSSFEYLGETYWVRYV